ncbi:MAG: DUF1460 domain-containing protein [Fimbriimonadaceae bacterium]
MISLVALILANPPGWERVQAGWHAIDQLPKTATPGDRWAAAGKSFIGTPYVGGTLEQFQGNEQCIVIFDGLDCVTFVETAWAVSCSKTRDYDSVKALITQTRYRGGVVKGYASRLHYTRDWLNENIQAGRLWEPGRNQSFTTQESRSFNFMTQNARSYPHIKGHEQAIREIEKKLSSQSFVFVPKSRVKNALGSMQNGDFIALVDRRQGIDFSHVGLL